MVCVEAVDSEADGDVLELIRLGLPILVASLPIAIVKVINKVRRSYEIGAFDGETSLIEQHIDNLVNLGKIRGKITIGVRELLHKENRVDCYKPTLMHYASSSLKQINSSSNRLYADNHGAYGSYAGPYGVGCAEWDCFGGFSEECHTQQTKSGESGVPHDGFIACGEVAFSEAECKACLTELCNN